MLFTGENQNQFIHLLSGSPEKTLTKGNVKGLVFSEGQVFSYVMSTGSKVIAWIVKNEEGIHQLPYLEKSARLLLEAPGKLRVQRLLQTIKYVESQGFFLSDFNIDTFIRLDSLIAGKNYRKEWIIEKVSHGKL